MSPEAEETTQPRADALTDADRAAASCFADCCYDDRLRMPSCSAIARLVKLGVVEVLSPGVYGETPLLRQLGY
jgi:hypothetical protein